MNAATRWLALALLATASLWWLTGCPGTPSPTGDKPDKQASGDHKDSDHKHGDHKDGQDHDKPLTEKDVKMPESFKAGVARLEELHKQIAHLIEHGELAKVHRVAEEMALVARKMKELAPGGVAEDKLTEAGRLCNEVAGYFPPIDAAGDAGNKAETETIHKKMGATIGKLKALAR
jgi:hypothetical protein